MSARDGDILLDTLEEMRRRVREEDDVVDEMKSRVKMI
jgi:hypothetical protein